MLNDTARLKMMADKLYIEMNYGRIDNEWEQNFVYTVRCRLFEGKQLSDTQITKLEELFERY